MNGSGAEGGPGGDTVDVDARGLRCPAPVLRAAAAARAVPAGTLLRVTATDPAAAVDLPAWARMRGHVLVTCVRDGDAVVVEIRLAG